MSPRCCNLNLLKVVSAPEGLHGAQMGRGKKKKKKKSFLELEEFKADLIVDFTFLCC